jgi:spore cortex formation protein SpoVR/YcgB (stage V sporulation)
MLRWINEEDPRVQFNESAVEFWHYALRTVDPAVAKQAVLEHVKQHENIPATPAAISKRAGYIKSSRDAGQRAIEPAPQPVKHPLSWRARNPAEWDRLFEQGRAEGNAERKRATEARNGAQEPEHAGWMAA